MCQVGRSRQLSLNQPAECRKFCSLPPLPEETAAAVLPRLTFDKQASKQASPTIEMIVRSIIRNVGYDNARSVPSIQRSAFIFDLTV